MSLYQRKDPPHWWVKITHRGKCLQQSTGTAEKCKAQEYHDRLKASLWEQDKLGAKPKYTWNEAVVRYVNETSHKASSNSDKLHLRWLDQHLDGEELQAINRAVVDRLTQLRLAKGVANATVNRALEIVPAI